MDLLQALTKVVHELLQASFNQPNELVTTLAYRACNYITEMHAGGPLPQQPQAADLGITLDPTTTIFALDNPIIEVEATLVHMLQNHREMPRRHLSKEASRLEQLLKDAKQVLTAWGRDPNAPGAHEGVASIRNTIDALDWFHLAVEEGGVAQMEETLEQALQAIHRTRGYMDSLIFWLRARFLDNVGSPVKRRKASPQDPGNQRQRVLPEAQEGLPQRDPRQLPPVPEPPHRHDHDQSQGSGSRNQELPGNPPPMTS